MLQGFKQFILRGNVVDLAVGVVIGAAFTGVVNALVKDIVTPFIGAIVKMPDFSLYKYSINGSEFMLGDFLNALISFLIVSFVIYFFVVTPINKLMNLKNRNQKPADPTTKKCPFCISDIPISAKKCAYCTSEVA